MTSTPAFDDDKSNLKAWGWPTYVSLAATLCVMVGLLAMLDVGAISQQIAEANLAWVALGGLAHYATYIVRGERWRRSLLHISPDTRTRRLSLLVFFYNAVDNIIPAKLGDVYVAHLARLNCGIGRAQALGSIVFLRMVDAWFVLPLAMLASWVLFAASVPQAVLWSLFLGVLIVLGTTCLLLVSVVWQRTLLGWLPVRVQHLLHAFHSGVRPHVRQLGPIVGLTVFIWALEILWNIALVLGFGVRLRLFEGMFLTMLPIFASAFPLTPSGAGVVELTLFSCLRLLGVPATIAASVTVLNRLIDYWLHIVLGGLIWAFRHQIGLHTWRRVSPRAPVAPAVQEPML